MDPVYAINRENDTIHPDSPACTRLVNRTHQSLYLDATTQQDRPAISNDDERNSMKKTDNCKDQQKLQIRLPGNPAREEPAPAPPRRFMVAQRRGSTGMTMTRTTAVPSRHRTKARRQSGDAVNHVSLNNMSMSSSDNHNMMDINNDSSNSSRYNRPILLDQNDSIKLLKEYMDGHMEDHSDRDQYHQFARSPNSSFTDNNNNPPLSPLSKSEGDHHKVMMRIHRRKPRRQSGCAVATATTLESLKSNMPSLLLLSRENSVRLTQQKIPSRRASMTF